MIYDREKQHALCNRFTPKNELMDKPLKSNKMPVIKCPNAERTNGFSLE